MARTLTRRTRRQEQIQQAVILDRLTAKYQPLIRNEINAAMRRYARAYGDGNTLAMTAAEQGHIERTERLMSRLWRESGSVFADRVIEAAKSNTQRITKDVIPTTEQADRIIAAWALAYGGRKITQITSTTMRDINAIIAMGIEQGLSEREIAREIAVIAPTKSASRAQTIARTETHAASQGATQEMAEATGLQMVRVWTTAIDERTRNLSDGASFDHVAADGQRRGMNEPFVIEGVDGPEQLMYPGDPDGSAGNVINCRCCLVFELADN